MQPLNDSNVPYDICDHILVSGYDHVHRISVFVFLNEMEIYEFHSHLIFTVD